MSRELEKGNADVVLLYPDELLIAKVGRWVAARAGCRLRVSRSRSLPEIREAVKGAAAVVVDATGDHAQAADALLQAVARRGAKAVAVYTERLEEGFELFVRRQGALLLVGPLSDACWEGFLAPRVRAALTERPAAVPGLLPASKRRRPRRAA
ncbi:MAG: hypothetical protein ACOC46_03755 [Pirellulales bacterium]